MEGEVPPLRGRGSPGRAEEETGRCGRDDAVDIAGYV
jgi:hypothetical protein